MEGDPGQHLGSAIMIMMRKEQMDEFEKNEVRKFEDRMVVHLNQFFPKEAKDLGEPRVREEIRYGIQRAKRYEIVSEKDVACYIDMMFKFGRDFDKDPKLPWARRILNDPAVTDPSMKMERLREAADEAE